MNSACNTVTPLTVLTISARPSAVLSARSSVEMSVTSAASRMVWMFGTVLTETTHKNGASIIVRPTKSLSAALANQLCKFYAFCKFLEAVYEVSFVGVVS